MNIEKIFGAIASALHLDASEFTAALKDGEDWLAEPELTAKIGESIATQVKAAKEQQLKRGTRESWSAVEKWVKAQGFTPEDDIKGTALLEAYQEHLKGSVSGAEGQSKEDLVKNPLVKQIIAEAKGEIGKKYEALQSEFDQYKKQEQQSRVAEVAKRKLVEFLDEGKVILDVPGVNKQQRIDAVARFLDFGQIGLDKDGNPSFLDQDGNPKLDDYGRPVDFKKHVVSIGENLFGIQKQDPGKGGASLPGGNGAAASGEYKPTYRFANAQEYDAAKFSEPDPAKRAQMAKDYLHQIQEQQAAGS